MIPRLVNMVHSGLMLQDCKYSFLTRHVWRNDRFLTGCRKCLLFPRDSLPCWNGSRICYLGVFVAGRWPGSPPLPPSCVIEWLPVWLPSNCLAHHRQTYWKPHFLGWDFWYLTGTRKLEKADCADIMIEWTSRNSKHMPVWVNIQIKSVSSEKKWVDVRHTHTER